MINIRKILFCIIWIFKVCDTVDDIFIARQDGIYKCGTRSSYALAWLYDPSSITVKENESKFYPTPYFTLKPDWGSNVWRQGNSIGGPINQPIFDRRWENLVEYYTISETKTNHKLTYTTLKIPELGPAFQIPISIRTENEAHIYLCTTEYPPDGYCYWLMLQAWNGMQTALRKCTTDHIPRIQGEYADGSCKATIISNLVSKRKFNTIGTVKWGIMRRFLRFSSHNFNFVIC